MRAGRFAFVCAILLTAAASAATAQVLPLPDRPLRGLFGGGPPLDPNRAWQELTLSGNVLGGYDDNLTTPGEGDVISPRPSGAVGLADARARYWFGDQERSIDVSGRGYVNSFRNLGLAPSYGGDQSFNARTAIGRRDYFQFSQTLRYDPFFTLGAFRSVGTAPAPTPTVPTPDANPTNGLTEQRSWLGNIGTSLRHQWSRRTSTEVGFGYGWVSYADGAAYDSRNQAVTATMIHSISRPVELRAGYRRGDGRFSQGPGVEPLPLRDDTGEGGLAYTRAFSRTRRVSVAGGGGATYVRGIETSTRRPYEYWAPSAYGNARLDLGRSWTLTGDYRRGVAVLQGLTPEVFVSQTTMLSAGGYFASWLETVFSTAYAVGQTGAGVGQQYDTFAAVAQWRIRLARGLSSVVVFNHYRYFLDAAASESLGVSPELYRNAVRVGLSWSLPLYGSYVEEPTTPLAGRR
jgi:hypothetical protein